MIRIAFSADFHIGAAGNRIDPETGLNAALVRRAECARFVVEEGIRRNADLFLIGGDVCDSCRPTPSEVRLARDILERAARHWPTLVLLGNHEAPRSPSEKHALDLLRDIEGIRIIDQPSLVSAWRTDEGVILGPPGLETTEDMNPGFQIACLPWPNKQLLLGMEEYRRLSPGELNQAVSRKMLECAGALAQARVPGVPSILLGHFSVDTAAAGSEGRLMVLGGDWTLPLHELQGLDFDAILLGHIHKPQEWSPEGAPILYCGSPEAMGFGEETEEKSFCMIEIDEHGAVSFERVPTPHTNFLTLEFTMAEPFNPHMPFEDWGVGQAIVRVRISEGEAHEVAEITKRLEQAGAREVRIEVVREAAAPRRTVEISEQMQAADAIKVWLQEHPDFALLTADVMAEAERVEGAMNGGGPT